MCPKAHPLFNFNSFIICRIPQKLVVRTIAIYSHHRRCHNSSQAGFIASACIQMYKMERTTTWIAVFGRKTPQTVNNYRVNAFLCALPGLMANACPIYILQYTFRQQLDHNSFGCFGWWMGNHPATARLFCGDDTFHNPLKELLLPHKSLM